MNAMRFLLVLCGVIVALPTAVAGREDTDAFVDIDLSGQWAWSIDPYEDGYFGFHGGRSGTGHRRYDLENVADVTRTDPLALYEYDMRLEKIATLPEAWIGHAPEMRHYNGLVWYQRSFDIDPKPGERLFVEFEAVNYSADVYLNGKAIGKHEGGFTPFRFEVTEDLVQGTNWLTVGVDSRRTAASVPPPVTDWETYGGITRPVRILRRPATFISQQWVRLANRDDIAITVHLDGAKASNAPVTLTIGALNYQITGETDAEGVWHYVGSIPDGLCKWSPETPTLYEVEIATEGHLERDQVGFRTIEVDGEDILLNGQPVFLRGISVHEEEIGTHPTRRMTRDAALALLTEVKEGLGGNFVRLAHYPHSETMACVADELGLLVWSEIPVYWRIDWENIETLKTARNMVAENILRDRNRASVVLWSIGNETSVSQARNRFLSTLAADVRALDNTRLVTAALLTEKTNESGTTIARIEDPLTDALDVLAVNTYDGWYGPASLDEVDDIRWDLDFNKPLLISELGAGGFIGFSDPERPRKFSLEYQVEYYRQTLKMTEHITSLRGMSPWILKDFRSPRRQHPVLQQGWNRKGLITETGVRKPAFDVLAGHYRKLKQESVK